MFLEPVPLPEDAVKRKAPKKSSEMEIIGIRCPVGYHRLYAQLLLSDKRDIEGNLIEVACEDCRRVLRRREEPVTRVLHRYSFTGEHKETVVEPVWAKIDPP